MLLFKHFLLRLDEAVFTQVVVLDHVDMLGVFLVELPLEGQSLLPRDQPSLTGDLSQQYVLDRLCGRGHYYFIALHQTTRQSQQYHPKRHHQSTSPHWFSDH
jgi:hypothetical protein